MISLYPKNERLLDRLQLFAVVSKGNMASMDLRPFGIPLAEHFDPLRVSASDFHELMKRLDDLCFGPKGMPMPRWMYLAGTGLTGAVVGFGLPRDDCSETLCRLLEVPERYTGLVPLAVFMAIPTHRAGHWFAHNLASLGSRLPDEDWSGLGGLTKAVGLKLLRTSVQVGATQWDSVALFVHARLGTLELLSAYTPAHSDDLTLTYKTPIDDSRLYCLAGDSRGKPIRLAPTEWIDGEDERRIRALQADIESGLVVRIAGQPRRSKGSQSVPIVY